MSRKAVMGVGRVVCVSATVLVSYEFRGGENIISWLMRKTIKRRTGHQSMERRGRSLRIGPGLRILCGREASSCPSVIDKYRSKS